MSERITLANERMDIIDACNLMGMGVWSGSNAKLACPFGPLFHRDGGAAKSFRIYEATNSAYCFACPAYYSPVKLIAADRHLEDEEAAELILQLTGYVEPDLESRWEAARAIETPEIDTAGLATALGTYCARIEPMWDILQFDDPQATVFRKCLELTAYVRTDADVTEWLTKTKAAMRKVLRRS